ncbi:alpha-glucosidase [Lacticaseibacillus daqingensis]|uniref:alpha-glucosidase n=1 Tax=Lacticaseibacillus daqingensis TaxID=2486014 RepID=UPI000F78DED9|nr:alpha-glucosidase [Lacticaseibacillus daqingensis]
MTKAWWKEAVVYQVYTRSFQDSDGDGIGDIRGIINRLGYIKELGADVIWLNPIFKSPNVDNGYDISDYQAIHSDFGTMADFDELLRRAHHEGIKIILDLVVNHTSDEHPWFIESRKSRNNEFSDYYIWQNGDNGDAPNDWESRFMGSAWKYESSREQYYLHIYTDKQPDLNWRSKFVRESIFEMMRWWLDKGIDGFRMDVINMIAKPEKFSQNTPRPINLPEVQEYLKEMNNAVLQHYDIMTVGEMMDTEPELAKEYAGFDSNELNMIFQFQHMRLDHDDKYAQWRLHPLKLSKLKSIMSRWQEGLDGKAWNSLYWNNHDQPRVVSRFGSDTEKFRERSAKMLGAVLHYQQGTPYIYQGEELGMTNNSNFYRLGDFRDIQSLNAYHEWVEKNRELTPEQMLEALRRGSRDNARTPMQWDNRPNAGFTTSDIKPWIMVNPNYQAINAEKEIRDGNSVFSFYKQMNRLRRLYPIIVYGDYQLISPEDEEAWIYQRRFEGQTLTLIANWTDREISREIAARDERLLQSNYMDDRGAYLRAYEVKVYLNKN